MTRVRQDTSRARASAAPATRSRSGSYIGCGNVGAAMTGSISGPSSRGSPAACSVAPAAIDVRRRAPRTRDGGAPAAPAPAVAASPSRPRAATGGSAACAGIDRVEVATAAARNAAAPGLSPAVASGGMPTGTGSPSATGCQAGSAAGDARPPWPCVRPATEEHGGSSRSRTSLDRHERPTAAAR